jgi:leucyl aminopeptidase
MGSRQDTHVKVIPINTLPSIKVRRAAPTQQWINGLDTLLLCVDHDRIDELRNFPCGAAILAACARHKARGGDVFIALPDSSVAVPIVVGIRRAATRPFEMLSLAARLVKETMGWRPTTIGITALCAVGDPGLTATDAIVAALLARTEAHPHAKSAPPSPWQPRLIEVAGPQPTRCVAAEQGAHLARWLSLLPPNVLHPGTYRRALTEHAKRRGWKMRVYDEPTLQRLGAGAFLAVTRGSPRRDAAIVHLSYRPKGAGKKAPIALVGKGLCFDTGGLNLKTARGMLGMHADMAGSAVAVGLLDTLTTLKHPDPVDVWLALAENRIGPDAYTQQDVVKALNGTTIQVMHTDAEGRMVLADTLALASRSKPRCIIDFATLTGACVSALTERMSGAFTNRPDLRPLIEAAGDHSGERVWTFPMPDDFDEDLDSSTADVMQCLIDGKGDHIYAARFLSRFVAKDIPWVHIDLSAAERTGGLAHVPHAMTGFGVRFGLELLASEAFERALTARRHP